LKRVAVKLKEKESSKPKVVPRTKEKPFSNVNTYVETKNVEKTLMRASETEKKKGVGIKADSTQIDIADDVVITNEPDAEQRNEPENGRKKLQPVEYKGNFLGGQKAIKDKIFNKSRGSKSLQNATTLLFYLIQHSAWKDKNDKHKTYDNWYVKKHRIVASRSQEQMALDLGVSVSTIKRWLDDLERDELIERAIEGRENVYILGKVIDDTELFFYEKNRVQK